MRINVSVSDLTQAQFGWLQRNVMQEWRIAESATRVCVVFETRDEAEGDIGGALHVELPVRAWIGIIEHLKTVTQTAEALLTPDAMPDGI